MCRAILHNPKDYPDPHVFDPERYLVATPSGAYASNLNAPDPRTAAFGFGRRGCVGRHLADASLLATVSTVLATMNIIRAKDAHGKETVPEVAQTSGFTSHPKPFSYALECRSAKSRALLAATMDYNEL
jgi:cytochrome P450